MDHRAHCESDLGKGQSPNCHEAPLWLVDHYDILGPQELVSTQSQCLVTLERSCNFLLSHALFLINSHRCLWKRLGVTQCISVAVM